jgi:hypothetical protein
MVPLVVTPIIQLKVAQCVVALVAINVVDAFMFRQASAQVRFHHQDMFID